MKKCLLLLLMVLPGSHLNADNFKDQDRDLSGLIGRLVLVLSQDYVVSSQYFDGGPILWVNARLGRVQHPNGMLPSMGTRSETEMVPTASGLVLHLYGPYPDHSTQKAWWTQNDAKGRKLEVVVEVSHGNFIGIVGSYGENFPAKTIEDLLSLSQPPDKGR